MSKRSARPTRLVGADRGGARHDVDRVLVDVEGDVGLGRGRADRADAEARQENDARPRIELLLLDALGLAHRVEVRVVVPRVLARSRPRAGRRARRRRRTPGRARRARSAWCAARDRGSRIPSRRARRRRGGRGTSRIAGVDARAHDRARAPARRPRASPAAPRRRGSTALDGTDRPLARTRARAATLTVAAALDDVALGARDRVDRALVALLRRGAPREEAVLLEHHHASARWCAATRSKISAHRLASAKPGITYGTQTSPRPKSAAQMRSPVRLIADREDGVRVRVIDEARGQERVQQRLDARVRGGGVEQVRAKLVDHRLVGHRVERAELAKRREAHCRVPLGLDRRQVPAGALHVQDLDGLAEQGRRRRLHRRVAARRGGRATARCRRGAPCTCAGRRARKRAARALAPSDWRPRRRTGSPSSTYPSIGRARALDEPGAPPAWGARGERAAPLERDQWNSTIPES